MHRNFVKKLYFPTIPPKQNSFSLKLIEGAVNGDLAIMLYAREVLEAIGYLDFKVMQRH